MLVRFPGGGVVPKNGRIFQRGDFCSGLGSDHISGMSHVVLAYSAIAPILTEGLQIVYRFHHTNLANICHSELH